MRSLFITPMLPVLAPSDAGGKHRRAGMFLRALAAQSRSLKIVYLVPPEMMRLADDPHHLNRTQSDFWGVDAHVSLLPRARRRETPLNHYASGIVSAASQPQLFAYAGHAVRDGVRRELAGDPDCILVDRLEGMLPILCSRQRPRNLIFDMDDVYHKVRLRELRHQPWRPGTLPLTLHLPALVQAERRAVNAAAVTFVCSPQDQAHLRRLRFPGGVQVAPNAILPPAHATPLCHERTVLFLGPRHHSPNRFAADRLVQSIWPIIRAAVPDARLIIAGQLDGTPQEALPTGSGVEYKGFVEDLAALYASTRVVCTPIVHGSGTRLKLIEAASFARPIVSTAMGAEGLSLANDREIMLRETDADLAAACVTLLRDDVRATELGRAAHAAVLLRYDVRSIERLIGDTIRRIVAPPKASVCGPV